MKASECVGSSYRRSVATSRVGHPITIPTIFLTLTFMFCGAFLSPTIAAIEVYAPIKPEDARNLVLNWAAAQPGVTEAQHRQLTEIWAAPMTLDEADRVLNTVVQSFAVINADAARLTATCNASVQVLLPPDASFLKQSGSEPFFTMNLRLFYGRYLVERRMYDEALDQLSSIDPRLVVDPASLFFFRAVAHQALLEAKPTLVALDQLLKGVERVPVRYSATANLMQADIQALEEKSLGEIARLMSDSERRLELGRAGEKVQGVQERIITELDEIIKKIESQKGGGGGGGGGEGGDSNQSSNPASDSGIKGSEAPGEVDKKKFSKNGQWGNLPEKDQAKAKSDLNRNFPSHYQRAVDLYFRKQSERAAKSKP